MSDENTIVQMRALRPLKAGQMCTGRDVAPLFERDAARSAEPSEFLALLPDGTVGTVRIIATLVETESVPGA